MHKKKTWALQYNYDNIVCYDITCEHVLMIHNNNAHNIIKYLN